MHGIMPAMATGLFNILLVLLNRDLWYQRYPPYKSSKSSSSS